MERAEFDAVYNQLTNRPKEAFELFLAGQSDSEIAAVMFVTEGAVRKHIEKVAKAFGLKKLGERTSHRLPLMALCARYKPELLFGGDAGNYPRVVLSYWSEQPPDCTLEQRFEQALTAERYPVFAAGGRLRMGTDYGIPRIQAAISLCDWVVLLLSEEAGARETIAAEVMLARSRRDASANQKPGIVPILVNCPLRALNYELQDYLDGIPPHQWRSDADTSTVVKDVLAQLRGNPVAVAAAPALPRNRENLSTRPLPAAAPELPGGQVKLDSAYYIERPPVEESCYREILEPGALIRIKAPRQMGKTSLMARILHQAKEAGCETMAVSCQRAGSQVLSDLDTFLRWFCEQVGRRLGKLQDLESYWTGSVSPDKCHYYFEECLLSEIDTPLVVGLDEVDAVFPYQQVAPDFFGLLRSWFETARYNDRSSQRWQKLRLVIVHSTEVYIMLDVNQSPFNVGMPVDLKEFTSQQVRDLARRHGLDWSDDRLAPLMAMVGGHPFLLRLAFYNIQCQNLTLEQVLQAAPTDAGIFSDHLKRHLWNLQKYPGLLAAFSQVVATETAVKLESDLSFKLNRMGLVHLDSNEVTPKCDLYRRYFGEILLT